MGLSPDWSSTTRCSAPANSSVWLSRQTPERFPPGEGAEQSVEGLGDKGLGEWHRPTKVPGTCEKIHQAIEGSAEVRGWSGRTESCYSAAQVKVGGGPGRGQLRHLASEKMWCLPAPGPHQVRAGESVSLPKLSPSPVFFSSLSHRDYQAPSHPQGLSSQPHHVY